MFIGKVISVISFYLKIRKNEPLKKADKKNQNGKCCSLGLIEPVDGR